MSRTAKNRFSIYWIYLVVSWIIMGLPFYSGTFMIPLVVLAVLLFLFWLDLFLAKSKYRWVYLLLNPLLVVFIYTFFYSTSRYFKNSGKIYGQEKSYELDTLYSPYIVFGHSPLLDRYKYLGINKNSPLEGNFECVTNYVFYQFNDKIINAYANSGFKRDVKDQRMPSLEKLFVICKQNKFDSIIPINKNGYKFVFKVNDKLVSYNPNRVINSAKMIDADTVFVQSEMESYYMNEMSYDIDKPKPPAKPKPIFKDMRDAKYVYYNKDYYPFILLYNKCSNLSNTYLGIPYNDAKRTFERLIFYDYDVTLMDIENPSFTTRFILSSGSFPKLIEEKDKR